MDSLDGALHAMRMLNELGLAYMIVGSMSSNLYMVPRSTKDADIVIESDDLLSELRRKLEPEFRMDPQIGFETKLMTTKYLFHQPTTAFTLEVFLLSDDPHDRERFGRRQSIDVMGVRAFAPTAEDVIIQKIRWGRTKDRADVVSIFQTTDKQSLDWAYLHGWAERHGTRALLDQLVREADEELGQL